MKKIGLYFLIVSLTWLPLQVTFASAFSMPAGTAMSIDTADTSEQAVSTLQAHTDTSHCDSQTSAMTCCNDSAACSQMDHDCNHCVSFIALAQDIQPGLFSTTYVFKLTFSQHLTSSTTHSEYRPPRTV